MGDRDTRADVPFTMSVSVSDTPGHVGWRFQPLGRVRCNVAAGWCVLLSRVFGPEAPAAFVKTRLSELFLMSDLGPLRYILGIEVSSTSVGFFISQENYIQDLLACAALTNESTVEIPMEHNVHLNASDGDGDPLSDLTRYHHLVESLVYLAVTRLDISYPVHILSQFVFVPSSVHYSHLLRVLHISLSFLSLIQFVTASGLFRWYVG